jgi:hypothetical protein
MYYENNQTLDKWLSTNTDVGVQGYVSDGSLGWGLYWEKGLQTANRVITVRAQMLHIVEHDLPYNYTF